MWWKPYYATDYNYVGTTNDEVDNDRKNFVIDDCDHDDNVSRIHDDWYNDYDDFDDRQRKELLNFLYKFN